MYHNKFYRPGTPDDEYKLQQEDSRILQDKHRRKCSAYRDRPLTLYHNHPHAVVATGGGVGKPPTPPPPASPGTITADGHTIEISYTHVAEAEQISITTMISIITASIVIMLLPCYLNTLGYSKLLRLINTIFVPIPVVTITVNPIFPLILVHEIGSTVATFAKNI